MNRPTAEILERSSRSTRSRRRLAHIGLHVTAVLHSNHTDVFLPPH